MGRRRDARDVPDWIVMLHNRATEWSESRRRCLHLIWRHSVQRGAGGDSGSRGDEQYAGA